MKALAVTAALLIAATSQAETFRSAKNYVQLELPEQVASGAPAVVAKDGTTLVASFHGPSLHAAITRIGVPNRRAWRKDESYFKEVERGLAKTTPGYRRRRLKRHKLGKVPALDLVFDRRTDDGRERVYARFLFFRTFSITLMVGTRAGSPRLAHRRARQLQKTFKPYFK
ncbi:MAG: hypothetical protein KJO07_20580 [Deltaproteobacteria bacterium]|jgi:hypothetical protein|nr:hypothetical protein [Deltaproteobacteria bacterium]